MSRQGFVRKDEEYEGSDLATEVRSLVSTLDTDLNTISAEAVEEIRSVAASLEDADATAGKNLKYLDDLIKRLRELADYETGDPEDQAIEILARRKPEFLFFSEEKRQLQSEYDLSSVWAEPPAALANLAQLANLDLKTLYTATAANDVAQVEGILERANDRLKRRFYETWSQSNAAVRFRTDGQILEVLVREEPDVTPFSVPTPMRVWVWILAPL